MTLMTKDSYLPGTLVLNQSLVHVKSKYSLVVMITASISEEARMILEREGIKLRQINRLEPNPGSSIIQRDKRFDDTWTKLRVFELEEYEKVLLLDSDMLIRKNMDELLEDFELDDGWIAACHACTCNPRRLNHYPKDWIPENCAYTPLKTDSQSIPEAVEIKPDSPRTYGLLNSGTVLLIPSKSLADNLYSLLSDSQLVDSWIFPDQDLLAEYFRGKWKPLPYIYNALKTLRIIHAPLWRDEDVKCVHYILADKPWMQPKGTGGNFETVNEWWWDKYDEVQKKLSSADAKTVDLFVSH